MSVDSRGFRGTGDAGERAIAAHRGLAFVLGSAAFGYRSSSDSTTITGYLNRLQSALTFVNAGVPDFNSLQELIRLHYQITPLQPTLVLSYSMFNDIEETLDGFDFAKGMPRFPPGTPADFGQLLALTVQLQSRSSVLSAIATRIPRTRHLVRLVAEHIEEFGQSRNATDRTSSTSAIDSATLSALQAAVDSSVDQFVRNEEAMYQLSVAHGIRFVTVIQPMAETHQHTLEKGPHSPLYRRAVRRALGSSYCAAHCLNYSAIFDLYFERIPLVYANYDSVALGEHDGLSGIVFADYCHLLDAGNMIVARNLTKDLALVP